MKFWIDTHQKHLLAIGADRFYVNRKFFDFLPSNSLDFDRLKLDKALQIPFASIDRIVLDEKRKQISIFYSQGSEETIAISNDLDRQKILEDSKRIFPRAKNYRSRPKFKQVIRQQIAAGVVLSVVFSLTMLLPHLNKTLQSQMEKWSFYLRLIKGFTEFGVFKLAIIYLVLLSFIAYRIYLKYLYWGELEIIQRTHVTEVESAGGIENLLG